VPHGATEKVYKDLLQGRASVSNKPACLPALRPDVCLSLEDVAEAESFNQVGERGSEGEVEAEVSSSDGGFNLERALEEFLEEEEGLGLEVQPDDEPESQPPLRREPDPLELPEPPRLPPPPPPPPMPPPLEGFPFEKSQL